MEIRKILLVDDDEDIRAIARISLGEIGGWEVVLASSGAEALRLAEAEQPDVILLDEYMPHMDGSATLARLQAQVVTAAIPVIFMTAMVQKEQVVRYLDLGAAGVISKPFDPIAMPDEIAAHLRARPRPPGPGAR